MSGRGKKKTGSSLRSRVLRSRMLTESYSDLHDEVDAQSSRGAASLLAQAENPPNLARASLNVPQPTPRARESLGGNQEALTGYIQEVVTAAVGASRAEDFRFFTGEMERSRTSLREELTTIIRDALGQAPTPETAQTHILHGGRKRDNAPNPAEYGVPIVPPRVTSRFSSPSRSRSPARRFSPPRTSRFPSPPRHPTVADPTNMDEFLSRLHNLNLSDPNPNSHSAPRFSGSSFRTQNFHKWGLRFDNRKMSVDDFLFRLERLRTSYGASWEEVVINFHHFVAGPVETWFWVYLKANPDVTWPILRTALLEQFRSLETDFELSRMLYDRHQGSGETFDEFFSAIQQLNSRLRIPKPDREIIDVVKNNVKRQMGMLIITFHTTNLAEMVHVCRKVEKYLLDREAQKFRIVPAPPPRRTAISELDLEDREDDNPYPVLEALHPGRERDTRSFTCWNCKTKGHSFFECPNTQRALFCFRCGMENTTSPQCPRCAGNDPKSSLKSRGNCSLEKTPETK